MNFDVIIIGGGPGGYVCAIKSAQLGLKVAIVDKAKSELGGTCLTKGCIPTKAILQSAKILHNCERASEFGVDCAVVAPNLDKIIERAKSIISGLNSGVTGLLAKNKITFIEGVARFKSSNTLIVENDGVLTELSGKNIVIAVGAKPKLIPGLDDLIQTGLVWTSKEAIFPKFLPNRMLILGSGAIGIELAAFYNAMGTQVTITEMMERILIQEDKEISENARKSFEKQGIKILTSAKTQNFKAEQGKISVEIIDQNGHLEKEIFDVVVLAIGVVPNTKDLGLEAISVKRKQNGTIETNQYNETSVTGIYAIGDVAEAPWLAHKASREGIRVAEKIAGLQKITPINLDAIPSCTYSYPQVASVGMTEEKAKEAGCKIKVGKSYFRSNGKALATGEPDGFIKVIFDAKTGELLGAHMIGHEVTEMLPIFSLAISAELTEAELMATVFPHPTMSECLQEAVYSAFGMSING